MTTEYAEETDVTRAVDEHVRSIIAAAQEISALRHDMTHTNRMVSLVYLDAQLRELADHVRRGT